MVTSRYKKGDILITTKFGANNISHSRYIQSARIGDIFEIHDMDNDFIFSTTGHVIRRRYEHNHFRLATEDESKQHSKQHLQTKSKEIKRSDLLMLIKKVSNSEYKQNITHSRAEEILQNFLNTL